MVWGVLPRAGGSATCRRSAGACKWCGHAARQGPGRAEAAWVLHIAACSCAAEVAGAACSCHHVCICRGPSAGTAVHTQRVSLLQAVCDVCHSRIRQHAPLLRHLCHVLLPTPCALRLRSISASFCRAPIQSPSNSPLRTLPSALLHTGRPRSALWSRTLRWRRRC